MHDVLRNSDKLPSATLNSKRENFNETIMRFNESGREKPCAVNVAAFEFLQRRNHGHWDLALIQLQLPDHHNNNRSTQHILPGRFEKIKLVLEGVDHQFVIDSYVEVMLIG